MNNCLQQFFTVYHYICDTFKIFKLNSIIPILKLPLPFHNIICLPKRFCFLSYTHVYFCAEQKKIYFLSGSIICELAQSTFSFQILFFFWIGRMERMGGEYCHIVKKFRTSILFCDIYSVAINTQIYNDKFDIYFLASLSSYFFFLQIDCIRVFLKPVIPFILFSNNQIPSRE